MDSLFEIATPFTRTTELSASQQTAVKKTTKTKPVKENATAWVAGIAYRDKIMPNAPSRTPKPPTVNGKICTSDTIALIAIQSMGLIMTCNDRATKYAPTVCANTRSKLKKRATKV